MRAEQLNQLLTGHAPACDEEAVYQSRMLELLGSSGDPFSRDHFQPGHFTASGFILSPDGQAVLLIHHRKLDRWLQPGGHVDPEDTDLFAAACREVHEEVGIGEVSAAVQGIFDLDIHPIPARKTEPAHEHFDVRFLLRTESMNIVRNDETHDAAWTPLDELSRLMTDPQEQRVIRKLRALAV